MQQSASILFLVGLNIVLQLFDGVATYCGWQEFGEANPLLRAGFGTFGAGPTLVAAKLAASALVIWIARAPFPGLVALGLTFTFGTYTAFSLIPWSIRLFS